ncbi:hypothetical protein BC739_002809 [Kutzneria viridogrisea]|uniref:Uncharacterized protein n=3 Tax=Pseudonocardiaceae TaxID=2070 RepID=W5WHT7_9PSEU|nr:hypothetical protein KALB_7075 [Kutzneria albida DSM 43870]MBA8925610.1 hypothetical protein [Kutzneria viridogrisea]
MAEPSGDRATPVRIPPAVEQDVPPAIMALLPPLTPPRPRVVVRRDLLPALSVLSFVALVGLPVGWLWSVLAPGQRVLVSGTDQLPLLDESYHRFDDLVIFVLLGLGAGLVVGGAVWLLRERRGPVVLFAAVLGSALAAWLAMRVGVSWAGARFALTGAPANGSVIDLAPVLESGWVVLAQPLAVALAYGTLAAWNGMDDLGRRLG